MTERGRPTDIDTISEAATDEYLRRSSITFLEAAVSLMATHMSMDEVAMILEEEARQIREFG